VLKDAKAAFERLAVASGSPVGGAEDYLPQHQWFPLRRRRLMMHGTYLRLTFMSFKINLP
jgi:hypothetical protein